MSAKARWTWETQHTYSFGFGAVTLCASAVCSRACACLEKSCCGVRRAKSEAAETRPTLEATVTALIAADIAIVVSVRFSTGGRACDVRKTMMMKRK